MNSRYLIPLVLAVLSAGAVLPAQTAPSSPDTAKEAAVQLPAFTISSEKDTGYVGKSALSSTRIAVDLSELPQSVKVLNQSFLKAVNPFMLTDILNYTGGAQNGQLNWTPGRLNIRGYTGDGDYNDSFAPSAGSAVDSAIYERFEVIKGPSTVFLAADGTPGGVVNKITKSPLSQRGTTLRAQVGLFDANRVDLDTTGAFTSGGSLLYGWSSPSSTPTATTTTPTCTGSRSCRRSATSSAPTPRSSSRPSMSTPTGPPTTASRSTRAPTVCSTSPTPVPSLRTRPKIGAPTPCSACGASTPPA